MPAPIMVTNPNDNGAGSLRAAIIASNAVVGAPAEINFSGAMAITLLNALPAITHPVVIDGYAGNPGGATPNTNPLALGDNAVIKVELDGGFNNAFDGLVISAPGTVVKGLSLVGFLHALRLTSGNNTIAGDFIGLDTSGQYLGNDTGVDVQSANNIIGGPAAAAANVISASVTSGADLSGTGVALDGTAAQGNTVQGNLIGTDKTGTVAKANQADGIFIRKGAHNNLIGGETVGLGNVISGNTKNGIEILSDIPNSLRSDNNQILGNLIGTNSQGVAAVANGNGDGTIHFDGILVENARGTLIGDAATAAGNVISGNAGNGVHVQNTGGQNTILTSVEHNTIGLNNVANAKIANGNAGVWFDDVGGSFIGDLARNIIGGNATSGIAITGQDASSNLVENNLVGTNTNSAAGLGNGTGISLGAGASSNQIGGSTAAARNIISGNGNGIDISGSSSNSIQGNFIGTDINGAAKVGNTLNGILLENGALNNLLGGLPNPDGSLGQGNLISGNGGNGIFIDSHASNCTGNMIKGSFIGTDKSGLNALGNSGDGILLSAGSNSTTIGWTQPSAGNVISANTKWGIEINSNNNLIDYNLVGLKVNADPLATLPNGFGWWIDAGNNNNFGNPTHNKHNVP